MNVQNSVLEDMERNCYRSHVIILATAWTRGFGRRTWQVYLALEAGDMVALGPGGRVLGRGGECHDLPAAEPGPGDVVFPEGNLAGQVPPPSFGLLPLLFLEER